VNPADLANYSNLSMVSAMVIMTLAMVTFGAHMAALAPSKAAPRKVLVLPDGSAAPESADADAGMPADAGIPVEADSGADAGMPVDTRRSRQLAAIALNFTWLAGALLLVSVVLRGLAVSRPPWGNMFEFCVAACCVTTLTYCALARRNNWLWLGLFVTLPVLLALGLAMRSFYTEAAELAPALKSYWLGIHVTVAVLAVGLFTVACPIALLYLVKTRGSGKPLKSARLQRIVDAFPKPDVLDRLAYGLNMVGFILWTFTLVAGAIWAQKAWSSYWNWDPKEVWTFVVWAVYAAYMHARATAGWEPRKAMWIAVVGYVCILVNFFVVNVWFVGQHSYSGIS